MRGEYIGGRFLACSSRSVKRFIETKGAGDCKTVILTTSDTLNGTNPTYNQSIQAI